MPKVSDFFQPRRSHSSQTVPSTTVYASVPQNQVPQTLVWDVTYRCNLHCIHCYNADKYGYGSENYGGGFTILQSEPAKDVVDWATRVGIVHIHMLGGEPLLRKDLPGLISYATSRGLSVTVTSNGTLVTEQLAEQIIQAGTEQVSISLDGGTRSTNDAIRGKGTFDRILNGIQTLSAVRDRLKPTFEVGISFTLSRLSLDEMPCVLEIGRKYDTDVIVFQDLYDIGGATRQAQLSYTNTQATDAFEQLAAYVRGNPLRSQRPVIQIDTHYPLYKYLERKYRVGFVTPQRNPICPAVTNLLYMDSSGSLHACGITTNLQYSGPAMHDAVPQTASNPLITIRSASDIRSTFQPFLEARDQEHFEGAPCPSCDYRGDCLPCPHLMFSEKGTGAFDICRNVFDRESEFEYLVTNCKVRIVNSELIEVQDGRPVALHDPNSGEQLRIGTSGVYILGVIASAPMPLAVSEIIQRMHQRYFEVSLRQIERDVVDFVWWLRLLDIAKLSSECNPDVVDSVAVKAL